MKHAPLVEAALREAVSPDHLREHLEIFAQFHRHSGTSDEWQAARYIVESARGYGVDVEILEFDALISSPVSGSLTVLSTDGRPVAEIPARTRSFSAKTDSGGIEADLVHVPCVAPRSGEMIFSHGSLAGDYVGLDVTGKIVLTADGGPDGIRRAQERGAVAHIHIWPSDEDVIHEMIASSVWGTPTPASALNLPRIPVLGVTHADGSHLVHRLKLAPVRVRIETDVQTGWMRLPLAVATIPGASSPDFLLVGAHIDSWYEGVTDNATGDAALLETTRVLAAYAGELRCGVRFAWWPGHSTGRYAGSTWYADMCFRELRAHGIGYLNIDSPGVRESDVWDCRYTTGEVERMTRAAVHELSGQVPTVKRPLRAADQSFLGVGLPSLGAYRMLPLDHPDRKTVGGCGGAYWWHTPHDTLDKADPEILAQDTCVYLTLVARMCQPDVLPLDFAPVARDFLVQLTSLQEIAGPHFDLRQVREAAEDFWHAIAHLDDTPATDSDLRNEELKRLSRILNPVLFTVNGPYEMDPALQMPILPGLAPLHHLMGLEPESDEFQFTMTGLRRQRNRIETALVDATSVAWNLSSKRTPSMLQVLPSAEDLGCTKNTRARTNPTLAASRADTQKRDDLGRPGV